MAISMPSDPLVSMMDITARKQQEEALRKSQVYYQQAERMGKLGYWEWDHINDRLLSCSEQFAQNYEMSMDEALAYFSNGASGLSVIHPDDQERYGQHMDDVNEQREESEFEFKIITRSGAVRHVHVLSEFVRDKQGKVIKSFGTEQDITERVRAELALAAANVELENAVEKARELAVAADQANRAKTQFLANSSHELRKPLTGIIGLLQIVNDDLCESPQEERDLVQTALQSANHQLRVVNDVLDITSVEAGQLEISFERVWLAAVLAEVQQAVGVQAQQKGLALQFNIPLGLYLQVDPARLRQVLLNLMGNAIKFTETGDVSVSAQPAPDPDYALIEISDTGVGIEPEFLPSAFDKFSRADGSMSRKNVGTGLGLSITRGLVETMHGQVGLASEGEGRGTRAWLTLPLAGATEVQNHETTELTPA